MNTSESQFQTLADSYNEFHRPIFDGIVDRNRFNLERVKLLWVLKEPWEKLGENVQGGGWSVTQDLLLKGDLKNNRGTYPPMAYVSYAVKNDFIPCGSIPKMTHNQNVRDALRTISYINIKKFPGRTRAHYKTINEYFHRYKDFLFAQIRDINPDVIICGGTGHYFANTYGLTPKPVVENGPDCCKFDGRLWVFAYHPSQTTIGKQLYVDGITNTIRMLAKDFEQGSRANG
jgi:hypothetical protein